jgi:hypothetical protein
MGTTAIKVTNDEFKKIVNELIQKYGVQEALKHIDSYEIALPFEPKHSNDEINKLINLHCTDAEEREDHFIFFGSVRTLSGDDRYRIPEGFTYVSEWSNGYREVFVSKQHLASITVCEGDLSVVLYHSYEAYEKGYREAEAFYQKY